MELVVVGHSADRTAISEGLNYIYAYDPAQFKPTFVETAVFTSQYQLVRVAPGDYDSDGDIDLVASTNAINAPGLCPVTLYRNDATGHFTGTVTSTGGHEIECLSNDGTAALGAGDYDNDGDLDLVVGAFPGALRLLVNLCDGAAITDTNPFVKTPTDLETVLEYIPYDLDWSDFDGDGLLDLAAAYPLQREVRIYRNQPGTGLVALPRPLRTAPARRRAQRQRQPGPVDEQPGWREPPLCQLCLPAEPDDDTRWSTAALARRQRLGQRRGLGRRRR